MQVLDAGASRVHNSTAEFVSNICTQNLHLYAGCRCWVQVLDLYPALESIFYDLDAGAGCTIQIQDFVSSICIQHPNSAPASST